MLTKVTRLCSTTVLAVFVAATAACSNGANTVPSVVYPAGDAFTSLRDAKVRVSIREYGDLPNYPPYYSPSAIAAGPDKALWVTDDIDQDIGESAVARVATSGRLIKIFYYGGVISEGSSFADIAAGPDGALWLTDTYNGQILRMTTDGTFTGYPLQNSSPLSIVSGPDKALWFTASTGSGIGKITTSGKITLYPAGDSTFDIASGADGALWYTESSANAIGRITTHGKISVYTKGISPGAGPYSIAPGPDGALWFTEYTGGRIGRITTSGKITEYSRGITPGEHPIDLTAGPDRTMWFTETDDTSGYQNNAKIGRITMAGAITEYTGFNPNSGPNGIVEAPKGDLWFVEGITDELARIEVR